MIALAPRFQFALELGLDEVPSAQARLSGDELMALINCEDCGREVSSRAPSCPHCGGPISPGSDSPAAPDAVSIDGQAFIGSKQLLTKLAVKAIQSCNYKVDAVDEASGLVGFTTGMTWGSWSGVSGSIFLEEIAPNRFQVSGNAKQNVKGGQLIALDIGGEAKGKVRNIVDEMRRLARQ